MSNLKVERSVLMRDPTTGKMGYRNEVTGVDTVLQDDGTATTTGSATWDPPNIITGAQATTTVTVPGAALGDYVEVSFSLSLGGGILSGYVSAAGTVTVVLGNLSGADINLNSGTVRAKVIKP